MKPARKWRSGIDNGEASRDGGDQERVKPAPLATIKVSNPAMLAKIKINQLNTNLEDLPIMQTHLLTKLLAMTACTQIDYSGAGSKADAWHIAHFLKYEKDGATLRAFKTMKDFQEFVDTVEKCFCAIAIETKRDRAFFRDGFRPMRNNFLDACRKKKLDDLPADWVAYELAVVLFPKWAQFVHGFAVCGNGLQRVQETQYRNPPLR